MSEGPREDEELIERYRAGGPGAQYELDQLFERYRTRVALWCLRMSGDRESALDLAQEVFLKAYQNLESFRGESRFSTWLYTIARNHSFNHLRGLSRRPVEAGEELLQEIADAGQESVLGAMEREAEEKHARRLLNEALDETERKVMVLHFAEEMPLDAVTRMLGLGNPSGAKAYIVSAKRKLKRALERKAGLSK